ncbi:MAG: hypothetical protein NTU89_00695 [Candidatus Dependentiae bacterium]|nr:hypothetical protein [Candidatus Dependentiae bacterium]
MKSKYTYFRFGVLALAVSISQIILSSQQQVMNIVQVVALAQGNNGGGQTGGGAVKYGKVNTPLATIGYQEVTPGATFVAPNIPNPISQLSVIPNWTNVAGNTGQTYATCQIGSALLSSINNALSDGISVSVSSAFVPNATNSNYSDLIVSAYNQLTREIIGSAQAFPSVMQSNNQWNSSNASYQLSTSQSTVSTINNISINQAFGITSSSAPVSNAGSYPTVSVPANKQISAFMYSPNFANTTSGNLSVSPKNLALIPVNVSVVFVLSVMPNSSTGYFDGTITAYVQGSTTPLFTQLFPSITNSSSNGSSGPISNTNNSWSSTWYHSNIGGNTAVDFSADIKTKNVVAFTPAVQYPSKSNIVDDPTLINSSKPITSFMFSANFENGAYGDLYLSAENIALIPLDVSVVFALNVIPNTITGSFDGTISAFVKGTHTPICTQFFPSIVNSSKTGSSGPITNISNSWTDTWYVYNASTPVNIVESNGVSFKVSLSSQYPTSIFETPLITDQALTVLNYYLGFQDGSVSALELSSTGVGSSFLNAVNASVAKGNGVVFTASAIKNKSGYNALVLAYNSSNIVTPIASHLFTGITNWNVVNGAHVNTNNPVSNVNNSVSIRWVKYNNAEYLQISPSTGYQIQSSTSTASVQAPVEFPKSVFATPLILPAGQALTGFNYYLGFADNSVSALKILPGSNFLSIVNASIALGNGVVFTASAIKNKTGYDAVVAAYNSSDMKNPIALHVFPSITNWTTNSTGHVKTDTPILNANNHVTQRWVKYLPAQATLGFIQIYPSSGYQVQSSTSNATVQQSSIVQESYPTILFTSAAQITSFEFSPNFADGSYSNISVSAANLTLIQSNTSVVLTLNVQPNATTGYFDATITALAQGGSEPLFTQSYPSLVNSKLTTSLVYIKNSSNSWNDTYYVSAVNGVVNPSVDIDTHKAVLFTSPMTSVAPANIYNPAKLLKANEKIASFAFSPKFSNGAVGKLPISNFNLALIPLNTSVLFTLDITANATTTYFDGMVSAFVSGSTTPLFTESFANIVASSKTGTLVPITNINNKLTSTLYACNGSTVNIHANQGVQFTSVVKYPAHTTTTPYTIIGSDYLTAFSFAPVFSDNSYAVIVVTPKNIDLVKTYPSIVFSIQMIPNQNAFDAILAAYEVNASSPLFVQTWTTLLDGSNAGVGEGNVISSSNTPYTGTFWANIMTANNPNGWNHPVSGCDGFAVTTQNPPVA